MDLDDLLKVNMHPHLDLGMHIHFHQDWPNGMVILCDGTNQWKLGELEMNSAQPKWVCEFATKMELPTVKGESLEILETRILDSINEKRRKEIYG